MTHFSSAAAVDVPALRAQIAELEATCARRTDHLAAAQARIRDLLGELAHHGWLEDTSRLAATQAEQLATLRAELSDLYGAQRVAVADLAQRTRDLATMVSRALDAENRLAHVRKELTERGTFEASPAFPHPGDHFRPQRWPRPLSITEQRFVEQADATERAAWTAVLAELERATQRATALEALCERLEAL